MKCLNSWKCASLVARKLKMNSLDVKPWKLRWKPVCSSTEKSLSLWLSENPLLDNQPRAVFAGKQTQAKGQKGRKWYSPLGGVWISAALPINAINMASSGILASAVAVALAEKFESKGIFVQIKWPNDILFGEKKLAGFLTRLVHRGSCLRFARIGLGLNVINRTPPEGVSIAEIIGKRKCNLNDYSAEILLSFERAIELSFEPETVAKEAFKRLWSKEIYDIETEKIWDISGICSDGSLEIKQGILKKKLIRF